MIIQQKVLTSLTDITQILITWFANNKIKTNHDKYHLLLGTQDEANIQIVNVTIKCSSAKKRLRMAVDKKFRFGSHVEYLCKKVTRKLNALARLANYMNLTKRCILKNAFFKSQSCYLHVSQHFVK